MRYLGLDPLNRGSRHTRPENVDTPQFGLLAHTQEQRIITIDGLGFVHRQCLVQVLRCIFDFFVLHRVTLKPVLQQRQSRITLSVRRGGKAERRINDNVNGSAPSQRVSGRSFAARVIVRKARVLYVQVLRRCMPASADKTVLVLAILHELRNSLSFARQRLPLQTSIVGHGSSIVAANADSRLSIPSC